MSITSFIKRQEGQSVELRGCQSDRWCLEQSSKLKSSHTWFERKGKLSHCRLLLIWWLGCWNTPTLCVIFMHLFFQDIIYLFVRIRNGEIMKSSSCDRFWQSVTAALCCSDSPGHLEEKVSQLEAMLKKLQDDLQKVLWLPWMFFSVGNVFQGSSAQAEKSAGRRNYHLNR